MDQRDNRLPPDHPEVLFGDVGVLLVNLGTPDDTDYWSVRRYLAEFLTDRRVIEVPRILWTVILNLFILTFRPFRTGAAYRRIWLEDANESPLRHYTRNQAAGLRERLPGVEVAWAMRYGTPSIEAGLRHLQAVGCERIVVFALYPQYSASTTATVYDEAFATLQRLRWQPSIRTVPPYHDHPAYIDAVARRIERTVAQEGDVDVVLASYHGIPRSYFEKGDPYHCHCAKTTRLLRERLGWSEDKLRMTFQSRFGPMEWLKPYTDEQIEALAEGGTRRLAVVMPGFAADCLETLEEIAIGERERFEEHGGEHFVTVPCLNDDPDHLDALADVLRNELMGWVDFDAGAAGDTGRADRTPDEHPRRVAAG